MPRMIVAEGCREVDGPSGTRYYARGGHRGYLQGGLFDVASGRDSAAIIAAGGAVASLAGTSRRATGYRCPACGFGSYTRTCGRCGGGCDREA